MDPAFCLIVVMFVCFVCELFVTVDFSSASRLPAFACCRWLGIVLYVGTIVRYDSDGFAF